MDINSFYCRTRVWFFVWTKPADVTDKLKKFIKKKKIIIKG